MSAVGNEAPKPKAKVGRKPGIPNKDRRAIIAYAEQNGKLPIEVMLDNMNFWDRNAESLLERLTKDIMPRAQELGDVALIKELVTVLDKVGDFRERAQGCAVDAAPYIHPRLANIQFKEHQKTAEEQINTKLTAKQAAELYAEEINASDADPIHT